MEHYTSNKIAIVQMGLLILIYVLKIVNGQREQVVTFGCSDVVCEYSRLNKTDKIAITNQINEFRNRVAGGEFPGVPQCAGNMKRMIWDEKLAQVAQFEVNSCPTADTYINPKYVNVSAAPANSAPPYTIDYYQEKMNFPKMNNTCDQFTIIELSPMNWSDPESSYARAKRDIFERIDNGQMNDFWRISNKRGDRKLLFRRADAKKIGCGYMLRLDKRNKDFPLKSYLTCIYCSYNMTLPYVSSAPCNGCYANGITECDHCLKKRHNPALNDTVPNNLPFDLDAKYKNLCSDDGDSLRYGDIPDDDVNVRYTCITHQRAKNFPAHSKHGRNIYGRKTRNSLIRRENKIKRKSVRSSGVNLHSQGGINSSNIYISDKLAQNNQPSRLHTVNGSKIVLSIDAANSTNNLTKDNYYSTGNATKLSIEKTPKPLDNYTFNPTQCSTMDYEATISTTCTTTCPTAYSTTCPTTCTTTCPTVFTTTCRTTYAALTTTTCATTTTSCATSAITLETTTTTCAPSTTTTTCAPSTTTTTCAPSTTTTTCASITTSTTCEPMITTTTCEPITITTTCVPTTTTSTCTKTTCATTEYEVTATELPTVSPYEVYSLSGAPLKTGNNTFVSVKSNKTVDNNVGNHTKTNTITKTNNNTLNGPERNNLSINANPIMLKDRVRGVNNSVLEKIPIPLMATDLTHISNLSKASMNLKSVKSVKPVVSSLKQTTISFKTGKPTLASIKPELIPASNSVIDQHPITLKASESTLIDNLSENSISVNLKSTESISTSNSFIAASTPIPLKSSELIENKRQTQFIGKTGKPIVRPLIFNTENNNFSDVVTNNGVPLMLSSNETHSTFFIPNNTRLNYIANPFIKFIINHR